MAIKIFFYKIQWVGVIFFVMLLSALSSKAFAAAYELEIIQPRAGLSTENRFYKAYPGIEYNVRLGVIGGAYPYSYALTNAPEGMRVDENKGEIIWKNPLESNSPHTVTARVVDDEGSVQDVTWTVTVTTSGFKFVDSVGGNDNNAGTLAAPWQTLGKIESGSASDFVYFRAGTYSSGASNGGDWSANPAVWMAYPSETVTLDFSLNGYFIYNVSNRLYIDGFNIDLNSNLGQRGFSISGTESNITFRRNTFSGLAASAGNNGSYLFTMNSGVRGQYTVIQDNSVIGGSGSGYFYLGYANSHVLVENNSISNMTASAAISPKDGNNMWFIRGNDVSINGRSVFVQEYDSQGHGKGPVVIEYNYLESTSAGTVFNVNGWTQNNQIIFQRNTVRGRCYIRPTSSSNGPFHFNKNVIVNDSDTNVTDRIATGPEGSQGVMFYDDNLVGGTSDGIVDVNGYLSNGYLSYVGRVGWQIGQAPSKSLPPAGLRAIVQ